MQVLLNDSLFSLRKNFSRDDYTEHPGRGLSVFSFQSCSNRMAHVLHNLIRKFLCSGFYSRGGLRFTPGHSPIDCRWLLVTGLTAVKRITSGGLVVVAHAQHGSRQHRRRAISVFARGARAASQALKSREHAGTQFPGSRSSWLSLNPDCRSRFQQ